MSDVLTPDNTTEPIHVETAADAAQTPDTPGNDENGDGVAGGQTTANTVGDVLGI